jgi:hypothetical protein
MPYRDVHGSMKFADILKGFVLFIKAVTFVQREI